MISSVLNSSLIFKDKAFTSKYLALPSELRNYNIKEPLDLPATTYCKWLKSDDRWGLIMDRKSDKENTEQSGEKKTRNIETKKIRTKSVTLQPLHFILKIR